MISNDERQFNKNSRGYTHNLRRFIFIKRKRKNKSSFVFPLWTREEEEKKKRGTERGIITVWPKSRNLELTEESKKRKTSEPRWELFFFFLFLKRKKKILDDLVGDSTVRTGISIWDSYIYSKLLFFLVKVSNEIYSCSCLL